MDRMVYNTVLIAEKRGPQIAGAQIVGAQIAGLYWIWDYIWKLSTDDL